MTVSADRILGGKAESQTSIPVDPGPPPASGFCQWCGEPGATKKIVVSKPRYRTHRAGGKETRVVAKQAVEAYACDHHYAIVQREEF